MSSTDNPHYQEITADNKPVLTEKFRDWRDFTDRVCRPLIDNDGTDVQVEAWYHTLLLNADPYYLATALVMADNRIREYESDES